MKSKRKKFLNRVYTFLFFSGLFLGFGVAGAVDRTDVSSLSCQELIITSLISVVLMIPLVISFKRANPWSK